MKSNCWIWRAVHLIMLQCITHQKADEALGLTAPCLSIHSSSPHTCWGGSGATGRDNLWMHSSRKIEPSSAWAGDAWPGWWASNADSRRHAAVGENRGISSCFLGSVGLSCSAMLPPVSSSGSSLDRLHGAGGTCRLAANRSTASCSLCSIPK